MGARSQPMLVLRRIARRFRGAAVSGSEMVLAVVLVLLFFSVFTGILVASFPKGSGLSNLYGDLIARERESTAVQLGSRTRYFVAELVDVTRTVKDRPPHEVAWRSSSPGMALGNNHAVQTFADSGASISFEGQGRLTLGPNSLVVLRQQETRYNMLRDRAALVVLGGAVSGHVPRGARDQIGLEIVAGGATATLESSEGQPAQFAVTVNEDESATLRILAGAAEVSSGGETAVVGPDEALTLRPAEPLGPTVRVPASPRLTSPANGAERAYGTAAPRIDLRWTPSDVERYRLVVARDPELTDVVYEGSVPRSDFEIGSLTAGRYHWAVTALRGEVESRPGEVRSFVLVQDLDPPSLTVDLPQGTVDSDQLVVRGRTDPGARVLVGLEEARTGATGEFELTVSLRPGPNVIVVEAVDPVGNAAYFSQYVNAKPRASRDVR